MLQANKAFSGFSVKDLDVAEEFYSHILALDVSRNEMGVEFIRYDNMPASQDEKGILRGKKAGYGPDITWFKDPFGNILSVLSD